jgi:hypothetical protein
MMINAAAQEEVVLQVDININGISNYLGSARFARTNDAKTDLT